jgi:Xaa-Pro aminopeptidase
LIRERFGKVGAKGIVISQLDEVAWLFNLRGSDIPYNPVRRVNFPFYS